MDYDLYRLLDKGMSMWKNKYERMRNNSMVWLEKGRDWGKR